MSWEQLLSVYREAQAEHEAERSRPPVDCPNDGTPLVEGKDGRLRCPFDGWPGEFGIATRDIT